MVKNICWVWFKGPCGTVCSGSVGLSLLGQLARNDKISCQMLSRFIVDSSHTWVPWKLHAADERTGFLYQIEEGEGNGRNGVMERGLERKASGLVSGTAGGFIKEMVPLSLLKIVD